MKKILFSSFLFVIFALSFGQVFAFVVAGDDENLILEEVTFVGVSSASSADEFSVEESSTVVGNSTSSSSAVNFEIEEESTVVGVPEIATTTATTTEQVVIQTPVVTRSGSSGGRARTILPVGQVLGAQTEVTSSATSTCELFTKFMKKGANNDVNEVKKLQNFLNKEVLANLPITGFFGPLTEKAVKDFQTKNKEIVLAPWVKAGIMKDTVATGYFYKTTQYAANKILCPNSTVEMPVLK